MKHISKAKVFFALLMAACLGCQDSDPDAGPTELVEIRARMEVLYSEIGAIANAACAKTTTESPDSPCCCKYIGLGDKPCGGYWEYLVYSSTSTDEAALYEKANAYNTLSTRYQSLSGDFSDCAYVSPPDVACVNQLCQ